MEPVGARHLLSSPSTWAGLILDAAEDTGSSPGLALYAACHSSSLSICSVNKYQHVKDRKGKKHLRNTNWLSEHLGWALERNRSGEAMTKQDGKPEWREIKSVIERM